MYILQTCTFTFIVIYVNMYIMYPLCTDAQYMRVYICGYSMYICTLHMCTYNVDMYLLYPSTYAQYVHL